ncbi:MAG: hypothetical protein WDO68_23090 [Gammaproteobacteria bacterium]
MKQVIRFGGIASALCIVTMSHVPGLAFGESASVAEAGWAKMTRCAAIGDDKARHTCTDEALREAGLLTEETKAAAKRQTFGLQKPAPSPAAAPVIAASAAPQSKKEESEQLDVTLAKVEEGGDGKLVLTTTEGAVWRQVESETIRLVPAQGQAMKIEMRSLGGFMCRPSKYVSFRCYRSK